MPGQLMAGDERQTKETIMTKVELAKLRTVIPEMRRVRRIHFIGIGGAGMGGSPKCLPTKDIR